MKKNFIKYIAALAVAPMLLSSCSDDFLNEIDPNRHRLRPLSGHPRIM